MTDERTPLSAMMIPDNMTAVPDISGHRPWDMAGPRRFPMQGHAAISAFYWIGATVLGSIIWLAVVRMLQ